MLYNNDCFGLTAQHLHVFWLYFLFAVNVKIDCKEMLIVPFVKLSSPQIQLHVIWGLPKVSTEHIKVTDRPSSNGIEVFAFIFGGFFGASTIQNFF